MKINKIKVPSIDNLPTAFSADKF